MQVEITIQAASIKTNHEVRDKDIRGENFMDTDNFPGDHLQEHQCRAGGEDRYTVTGDLTIKENTQSVALQMTKLGEFNDPDVGHRIGYSGSTKINRKDFGMTFNPVLDGRFVVSDEINIMLEGELVEQAEETTATA